ncbi:uncharacterized protein N7459_004318, partial [Penicillium hispanicum]|uniref:uncharacterized protein n=1 Tax=Penicillium hispanicum TaxID=1080232 RepID=UPI0025418C41
CDETRPACSNCTHRRLGCTDLRLLQVPADYFVPASPSGRDLPGNGDSDEHVGTLPEPSGLKYSIRDLELIHQFSTETYKSTCGDQSDMEDWQSLIPRHAYAHEFLLHGILAVVALHITATTPNSKRALSYLNTALHYNSLSVGPFRQALDHLTPHNCDAVFACSAIVMVIGIGMPCISAEYRGEPRCMVENMVTAFELLQSASSISRISASWLQAGIFSRSNFWEMPTAELDREISEAIEELLLLNHSALTETIELMRSCFSKFVHTSHPAAILAWLGYVKEDFVNGVRSRASFQLLVLMYWGVLLNELGNHFSGLGVLAKLSWSY